jgi:hypothetical protein
MPLSHDIRDKAADLLAGEIDLREFEDWLIAASWNVHRDADAADAAPLAYHVELLFSELSGGYRNPEDLRAALAEMLQHEWATFTIIDLAVPLAARSKTQVFSGARTPRVTELV